MKKYKYAIAFVVMTVLTYTMSYLLMVPFAGTFSAHQWAADYKNSFSMLWLCLAIIATFATIATLSQD